MIKSAYIVPHPPLIIPEIGRGRQNGIGATIEAYENIALDIASIKPEAIIFISPHSLSYSDYIHIAGENQASGNFESFGVGSMTMSVEYDTDLVQDISRLAAINGLRAGTLGGKDSHKNLDHGIMVPMYFINKLYNSYKAVRISISGLPRKDHYRLGVCIRDASKNKNVVIIASGDLSHKLTHDGPYGFDAHGPEFDKKITSAMARGDFLEFLNMDEELCESASECGLRSFIIMSGAFDGIKLKTNFMSYEGPFGVGYAVCAYHSDNNETEDPKRFFLEKYERDIIRKINEVRAGEDAFVKLARASLEAYIKTGKEMKMPDGLPAELTDNRAGVFVSIKKHGQLRGCIGTICATKSNIAEEIIANAISSGVRDSRFDPVTEDELKELVYSVDVLGIAERIPDKSMLDIKRYGVIVTSGFKRGLLLPNLEGVETIDDQLNIALRKGGIAPDESYVMERFEVIRHK